MEQPSLTPRGISRPQSNRKAFNSHGPLKYNNFFSLGLNYISLDQWFFREFSRALHANSRNRCINFVFRQIYFHDFARYTWRLISRNDKYQPWLPFLLRIRVEFDDIKKHYEIKNKKLIKLTEFFNFFLRKWILWKIKFFEVNKKIKASISNIDHNMGKNSAEN